MTKEQTVKVNLNNACSVILTQYGAEILNESNKKLEQQCPALKLSRYQAGERYEVQLWQMIQDFGHYMGMECVSPIEMVIELEMDKVREVLPSCTARYEASHAIVGNKKDSRN